MIKDSLNFPLIPIEITSNVLGRIAITRIALEKAISQMAEHASIGVMRNALVDAYRASDSDVATLFNSFSGTNADKYRETIAILNADNPEKSDIVGFDHKAYQADYKSKFDILNAQLLYEIRFTDSTAVEFAKFLPVSFGVEFDLNLYTLKVSDTFTEVFVSSINTIRKNPTVLSVHKVVGNSYTRVGKFYYTNRFGLLRPDYTITQQEFYANIFNQISDGEIMNPTRNQLKGEVYTVVDVDNTLIQ